ncbi:ShlB/FhaC/HecB family hemolysin secretion/activation protein [Xenorhabdus sp. DI]|uniref:ShlB/FhaC/HecB family hemolysin secretion/activation protein n=1 Tax=Xenorhabdus doucetiae TaxID=351671 RepID=UPI00199B9584|nr:MULTISPECIES: ShlB/FhaC/HecB family hemolysin secretion/activation protein [unclassified Xenorhabdus]MBD2783745.1 ShlB/FhaC/HecB family hemolysin secretion/activation protein [Xenorhabdus sp. 3]MBD2788179.1 ShlB/FhaC/HecB family hemolysin secretion/activation protein [Xenorhabdus sp. DI]
MIKRTTIFILLCTAFQVSASPDALTPAFPTDEARRTLQDSSREIDQLIEERRHQRLINRTDNVTPQTVSPVLVETAPCLTISGVYLQGITLLSLKDLNTLSALPDSCITSNDINTLSAEITNLYIAKGYITARVQFIPPNANGELGINVVEGFVEAIEGGDRWVNSQTLFPRLANNPLNLNQLDQGLDQANRLQSNKTTLDILPGTINGGSIVKLRNRHTSPWRITTTTDNYGQKNTGKWITRLNASVDSPLGLSDFVSLSGVTTVDKPATQYNRAYTLFYSLPYGAMTFSGFNSYSQYIGHPHLRLTSIKLYGNSRQTGVRAEWVFHRNQSQISTLNTQLVYKQHNSHFNEVKIGVNSQTLSVLELGVTHLHILPSGFFSLNMGVEQGMPWFGAQTDTADLNKQFTKGKLSANLQQRFTLFDVPYRFNSQFYAQYSRNGLPGVEWLNLTDRNAVRGFSKNVSSADNGWYLRNTLSHAIPIAKGSLSLRTGVDIGQVKGNRRQDSWKSSAGLSAGLTLRYQHLFADIEISRGKFLSHPKNRHMDEPMQLSTRFSYTF